MGKICKGLTKMCYVLNSQTNMNLAEFKWRAKMAFKYADADQNGFLTKYQYKIAMTAVFGHCPDKLEINRVLDSCGGERITYDKFEYWTLKKCSSHLIAVDPEILFVLLDGNSKGYLTANDFCRCGKIADLRTSAAVWQKVYHSIDKHRKGYVDLYEFLHALTDTMNGR